MVAVTADKVVVELEAKLDRYMAEVRKAQSEFDTRMRGIEGSAKRAEATLTRFGSQMKSVFGAFSAAMVFRSIVNETKSFDESMTKIVTLVGVSRDQVNAWKEDLIKMGPEVGKSPSELADALFFVTSAGLRGKAALDALKASAEGSSLGLGETKVVADAATSAVNAYGAANLDAEKAVAILVATVREGKAEAPEIAAALGQIVPIASAVGVGFDQVGASIAAMTRLGANAAESATSLSAILSTVAKGGTHEADVALGQLGLSFSDLRKSLRDNGLIDTLLMLQKKIGDNEEAMTTIFPNVRALRGLFNLLGSNVEEARRIFASMATTVADDLKPALADLADDPVHKLNQALADMNAIATKLGGEQLPWIVEGLKKIAEFANNADFLKVMALVVAGGKIGGLPGAIVGAIAKPAFDLGYGAAEKVSEALGGYQMGVDYSPITGRSQKYKQPTSTGELLKQLGWDVQSYNNLSTGQLPGSTPILSSSLVAPTKNTPTIKPPDPKAIEAWNNAVLKLKQANEQLVEQAHALDQSSYASLKNEAATQLRNLAEQKGLAVTPAMTKEIDKQADAYARNTIALREQTKLHELAFEQSQLGRSDTEQQVASTLQGVYGADWQTQQDGAIAAQVRLNEQIKAGKEAWQGFGNDAWDAMQSIFDGSKSAKDAVLDLIKQLLLAEAKALFLNSIGAGNGQAGPLSSIFSLFGLGGGSAVTAIGSGTGGLYASGGIADQPSIFGEAGPEAAIPLPDGRSVPVTIRMPKAPSGGDTTSTSVTINSPVDARGSNLSEAQFKAILDRRDQNIIGQIVPTVRQAQSRKFL